jgi:hypothetical protein
MNPVEHVGTLYIENQRLLAEYQKLLGLVQQIKEGKVHPENVSVDLAAISWSVEMTGEQLVKVMAEPCQS